MKYRIVKEEMDDGKTRYLVQNQNWFQKLFNLWSDCTYTITYAMYCDATYLAAFYDIEDARKYIKKRMPRNNRKPNVLSRVILCDETVEY